MRELNSIQDNLVFTLFVAGLIFMIGVIHYQENIDGFWAAPASLAQVTAPANRATEISDLPTSEQIYVQNILNQPENIYNPATDKLTPAQTILKGGTKFLIGL